MSSHFKPHIICSLARARAHARTLPRLAGRPDGVTSLKYFHFLAFVQMELVACKSEPIKCNWNLSHSYDRPTPYAALSTGVYVPSTSFLRSRNEYNNRLPVRWQIRPRPLIYLTIKVPCSRSLSEYVWSGLAGFVRGGDGGREVHLQFVLISLRYSVLTRRFQKRCQNKVNFMWTDLAFVWNGPQPTFL